MTQIQISQKVTTENIDTYKNTINSFKISSSEIIYTPSCPPLQMQTILIILAYDLNLENMHKIVQLFAQLYKKTKYKYALQQLHME